MGQRAYTAGKGEELVPVEYQGLFIVTDPKLSGAVTAVGADEANMTDSLKESVKVVVSKPEAAYVGEAESHTDEEEMTTSERDLHMRKVRINASASWEFDEFADPGEELMKDLAGQAAPAIQHKFDQGLLGVRRNPTAGADFGKQQAFTSPLDDTLTKSAVVIGTVTLDETVLDPTTRKADFDRFAASEALEIAADENVSLSDIVWTSDINRHRRDARAGASTTPLYGELDPDYEMRLHVSNNLGRFANEDEVVGVALARTLVRHRISRGIRTEFNPFAERYWDTDTEGVRILAQHGLIVPVPCVVLIKTPTVV